MKAFMDEQVIMRFSRLTKGNQTMKKILVSIAAALALVESASAQVGENLEAFRQIYSSATAPVNGTSAVQTLTFGAVTGGTFKLTFEGRTTAAITWSATNATLFSNIDTALEALPNVSNGAGGGVTVAAGTIVNGANGTLTVTFGGNRAKQPVGTITADSSALTGGTISSVTQTTPGVTADGRIYPKGTLVMAKDTGKWYTNSGTPPNPVWSIITSTP